MIILNLTLLISGYALIIWGLGSIGVGFSKPSSHGFTALRIPFHRDPYHRALPALGNPYPQLHLHRDLWFIAVEEPRILVFSLLSPLSF